MSSDGCSCGSSCKCGDSCSCGKSSKFPDLSYSEKITSTIMISGVAPVNRYHTQSSQTIGSEGDNGCKCGSNCSCDPCKC